MAACYHHPDRPGIGVCMRCRVVICADCCTKLDGINHCYVCLKQLAKRPARTRRPSSIVLTSIVLSLALLGLWTLLWFAQGNLSPGP